MNVNKNLKTFGMFQDQTLKRLWHVLEKWTRPQIFLCLFDILKMNSNEMHLHILMIIATYL